MNLEGILSIAGKPGLYKLVAQSKNGLIVESILENRRFPVNKAGNISALKDIAIYTETEEVPLEEVFQKIAEKEDHGAAIDHKEKPELLGDYLAEVLPDYDRSRVYNSDLKKLFQWYNLLQAQGLLTSEEEEADQDTEEQSGEDE
jgi:hypothetical protein